MAASNLHSLNSWLTGNNSQIKRLTVEAQQLIHLRDTVRRQLPPALAPHCIGAQHEAGVLVIYMDSAATATPVRYQQQDLLSKLAAAGLNCQSLKVQVLPDPPTLPAPKAPPYTLSNTVRRILETTASQLAEGSLKNSLQHLARNRNPRR
ncbi:MAG: DciA family protein [Gammaproteobacteria bacterium]